jgi:hypothetical protein
MLLFWTHLFDFIKVSDFHKLAHIEYEVTRDKQHWELSTVGWWPRDSSHICPIGQLVSAFRPACVMHHISSYNKAEESPKRCIYSLLKRMIVLEYSLSFTNS